MPEGNLITILMIRQLSAVLANTLRPRQNGRHLQTTFANPYSYMDFFLFYLNVNWILLPINNNPASVPNGSASNRRQASICTNDNPVYRCIYGPLGINDSTLVLGDQMAFFKLNGASFHGTIHASIVTVNGVCISIEINLFPPTIQIIANSM